MVYLCSVLIHIMVVGREHSLLFTPSGEVFTANGKENVCGRCSYIFLVAFNLFIKINLFIRV